MKLINEKCPNMGFTVGKEVVKTDAQGVIEIDSQDHANALIAGGFKLVEGEEKKAKKPKAEKIEKVEEVIPSKAELAAEAEELEPEAEEEDESESEDLDDETETEVEEEAPADDKKPKAKKKAAKKGGRFSRKG
jgi:hypothetical protein